MGKILVFAEKPSVGKDIGRVLRCNRSNNGYLEGDKYIVTWAMGHLVTLADPETYDKKYAHWSLEQLPIIFDQPKFTILKPTARQYKVVSNLMNRKDVTSLVIATDAGREGELVARLVIEKNHFKKPIKRLWISSVTDKAITEGFKNLRDGQQYYSLYQAALARSESDWLVGINATRALTTKYNSQLSCGRVQTPTLQIIFDQDEKIKNFKPKEFYTVNVLAADTKFSLINKNNTTRIDNKEEADALVSKFETKAITITNIVKKDKSIKPKELYDLTTLQKEANHTFGYGAKHTLDIIQSLYEYHKCVTYPRTDSKYLTADMKNTLKERIDVSNVFGFSKEIQTISWDKVKYNNFINDNKVSDHHAIIPTEQRINIDNLNGDEQRIYKMIVLRYLSVFLKDHVYEDKTIEAKLDGFILKAKGKEIKQMGFYSLFNNSVDEEDNDQELDYQILNNIEKAMNLPVSRVVVNSNYTKAPKSLNEGSLLMAMENPLRFVDTKAEQQTLKETGGIGTVATRADIIEKLLNSFLIEKSGQAIHITSKGKELLKIVPTDLKSPSLTAKWESQLKLIEQKKLSRGEFISGIKKYTKDLIYQIKNDTFEFHHDNMTEQKCSKCNANMLFVSGKTSKMLVCSNFECKDRISLNINPRQKCPNCSKRLKVIGDKFEKQALFCEGCGYRKSMVQIAKESKSSTYVSKGEVKKLLQQQKETPMTNNPFADIFKK